MAEEPPPAGNAEENAEPAHDDAQAPVSEQPPSTDVIQTIQRRNWTRGVIAVVGAILVLVGLGWGAGAIANSFAPPPAVQTLSAIEASADAESAVAPAKDGLQASLHWSDAVGQVVLTASGLPALPEGKEFEAWYVRGKAVFSAGTFVPTGRAATTLLNPEFRRGDTVEITIEKAGGADEGPTTNAVISIPTK